MTTATYAYKSDASGKLFETQELAEKDEIEHAAGVLGGVEPNHLINVATGMSTCKATRDAIARLNTAIQKIPASG
jgi:hypothetical protein